MDRTYEFTLNGVSPLLMHWDNIDGMAKIDAWRNDPVNKPVSVRGDDRSPAWTWVAYAYIGSGRLIMPADNIMTSLRDAGKQMTIPGKGKKTFKSETQSGIIPCDDAFDFLIGGKPIEASPLHDLWDNSDFDAHKAVAGGLGFKLFVKRAKIGQSKHIRVRPMFTGWSIKGSVVVTEDVITDKVFADLLTIAGNKCGLGDWRPSSQAPGPYGRFSAEVSRVA